MKAIVITWLLLIVGTFLSFYFTENGALVLMTVAAVKITLVQSEFMELRHYHSVYLKSAAALTIVCLGIITLVS